MTLRRIAAEVTQDQWDLIARLKNRTPELRCAASLQFEPGAWAWVEAQPDNDQSGLRLAVVQ